MKELFSLKGSHLAKLKKITLFGLTALLLSAETAITAPDPYVTFHTPKSYLSHINRGYIAMDMMDYPLALKEFLTAKYVNNDLFAAHEGLGMVYEKTRNYKESLESYERALSLISPKYAQDLVAKINYYKRNNQIKTTLGLYRVVLSIRPEAGLQMLYGDQSKANRDWQKALINYQRAYELQENPEGYLKYIQIKYPNKEYERYVIEKYIKKSLSYPEAHFKAGLVNMEHSRYYQAIDEFSKAVNQITVPNYENKYISFLAQAYYRQGTVNKSQPSTENLDKAISYFQKYLKSYPDDSNALFNLADSYFYKDIAASNSFNAELALAEKDFQQVQKLPVQDPEYIDKKNELNSVLNEKFNPNFFDKTIETLNRIKDNRNPDRGVHYSLGNVYFKKGNLYHKGFYDHYKNMNAEKSSVRDKAYNLYKKALEEYRTYISKNPNNNGLVYYDIGVVYYQSSKLDPNRYNLPITPENKKEYERWGTKYYRRDMLTRSIANFNRYLNNYPRAQNAGEVRSLVREMQLAMVALW